VEEQNKLINEKLYEDGYPSLAFKKTKKIKMNDSDNLY